MCKSSSLPILPLYSATDDNPMCPNTFSVSKSPHSGVRRVSNRTHLSYQNRPLNDLEIQVLEFLRIWRSDLLRKYTSQSVNRAFKTICRLPVSPGKLAFLANALEDKMEKYNRDRFRRETSQAVPILFIPIPRDFVREEDMKAMIKQLKMLHPRQPSQSDGYHFILQSLQLFQQYSWSILRERYSVSQAMEIYDQAFGLQKLVNRAVIRLATRYSLEQMMEFQQTFSSCHLTDVELHELQFYFLDVEEKLSNDEAYGKWIRVNPLSQFQDDALLSVFGEENVSKITLSASRLNKTIGLLGQLPKDEDARFGWESVFECKSFLMIYSPFGNMNGSVDTDEVYINAFGIQCFLNEIAYDLSEIFPLETVRESLEKICLIEVAVEDIQTIHDVIRHLKNRWAKDIQFRRSVIWKASTLFEDDFVKKIGLPIDQEAFLQHTENLWPKWTRIDLGEVSFYLTIISSIVCLCLMSFGVITYEVALSWLISQILSWALCWLTSSFGATQRAYKEFCASPKHVYMFFSRQITS